MSHPLKKAITYLLIFIVSFSYNYEAIEYFTEAIGDSPITWVDDLDCEEKESKESNEKNEKSEYSDELFLDNSLVSAYIELIGLGTMQNHNFSSSDYSQVVYSPPELI